MSGVSSRYASEIGSQLSSVGSEAGTMQAATYQVSGTITTQNSRKAILEVIATFNLKLSIKTEAQNGYSYSGLST